jgi:hypothetical protein
MRITRTGIAGKFGLMKEIGNCKSSLRRYAGDGNWKLPKEALAGRAEAEFICKQTTKSASRIMLGCKLQWWYLRRLCNLSMSIILVLVVEKSCHRTARYGRLYLHIRSLQTSPQLTVSGVSSALTPVVGDIVALRKHWGESDLIEEARRSHSVHCTSVVERTVSKGGVGGVRPQSFVKLQLALPSDMIAIRPHYP